MMPRRLLNTALALIATLFASSAGLASQAAEPVVTAPNVAITRSTVGIQMFMYNWDSVATECTNYLGPAGIKWVQVSPPQESIQGDYWWVHYQPVSYKLDSSLGSRAQFINMVQKCNTAGVQVIVDAVINHMANGSGTGYANSEYTKYDYPGIYSSSDFHSGLPSNDPNYCNSDIQNYDDAWETTHCELGSLPDLATEKPSVRQTIANYLNDMIDIGVSGFRVDAAKHFGAGDLAAVWALLHPVNGRPPVLMPEVIGGSDTNAPFVAMGGKVWAWDMPGLLSGNFPMGSTGFALNLGWTTGFNGSANTITMVSNHDTEHHGPTALTYKNGKLFQVANIFMLAIPFGIPELYTGYSFSDENSGPNTNANGAVLNARCPTVTTGPVAIKTDGIYTCVDRWKAIQGMIAWRNKAGTLGQTHNTYTHLDIARILSFNRGANWIAINASNFAQKSKLRTWLAKGTYCDVVTGGKAPVKSNKTCAGSTIVVDSKGYTVVTVPAQGAIAIGAFSKAK